ncbi:MAG TPA: hypothetical protein VHB21_23145 [Minicystis sp.]|nr:hypothetical protein [Minicystis sp.]
MESGRPCPADDTAGVVAASDHVPVDAPDEARAAPPREARRALAIAVLGLVCFGFLLGPLALALARRAELARAASPELDHEAGLARAAASIGRVGTALHLAAALAAAPWVLFMLPFVSGG